MFVGKDVGSVQKCKCWGHTAAMVLHASAARGYVRMWRPQCRARLGCLGEVESGRNAAVRMASCSESISADD